MIRYKTILADPPWPYKASRPFGSTKEARPKSYNHPTSSPSALARYKLMTIKDISSLAIPSEENAHLYLWTTNAFMVEAHAVARAWGFTPKTIITWVKTRKGKDIPSMGMGYYFRNSTEHLLFCVKGKMRLKNMIQLPTAFAVTRPFNQHSKKPVFFHELIEKASPGKYLELFARSKRPGWDVWGNEVESNITLETIEPPQKEPIHTASMHPHTRGEQ